MWTRTKCCGCLFPCIVILYKLSLLKRNRRKVESYKIVQIITVNYSKKNIREKMFKKGLPFLCEIIALS